MAGNEIVQSIRPEAVGAVLIERGWRQGSLLEAISAPKSWLTLSNSQNADREKIDLSNDSTSPGNWILNQEALGANDVLLVASQTCDIKRPPTQEPYIEVIRGYWSSDRSIIHQAGKNSYRLFLMQRRSNINAAEEALIADA